MQSSRRFMLPDNLCSHWLFIHSCFQRCPFTLRRCSFIPRSSLKYLMSYSLSYLDYWFMNITSLRIHTIRAQKFLNSSTRWSLMHSNDTAISFTHTDTHNKYLFIYSPTHPKYAFIHFVKHSVNSYTREPSSSVWLNIHKMHSPVHSSYPSHTNVIHNW